MPHIPDSLLSEMLPKAKAWAESQSQHILENGLALSEHGASVARRAGVRYPERVRLLSVPQIPLPDDADLRRAAQEFDLITPGTSGLTLGYGIFLAEAYRHDDGLVAHELKHVAQYESCGGFAGFLKKYLSEVNEHGYPEAPMEQEAIDFAAREFPTK